MAQLRAPAKSTAVKSNGIVSAHIRGNLRVRSVDPVSTTIVSPAKPRTESRHAGRSAPRSWRSCKSDHTSIIREDHFGRRNREKKGDKPLGEMKARATSVSQIGGVCREALAGNANRDLAKDPLQTISTRKFPKSSFNRAGPRRAGKRVREFDDVANLLVQTLTAILTAPRCAPKRSRRRPPRGKGTELGGKLMSCKSSTPRSGSRLRHWGRTKSPPCGSRPQPPPPKSSTWQISVCRANLTKS